jgi:hypothetical protein
MNFAVVRTEFPRACKQSGIMGADIGPNESKFSVNTYTFVSSRVSRYTRPCKSDIFVNLNQRAKKTGNDIEKCNFCSRNDFWTRFWTQACSVASAYPFFSSYNNVRCTK